MEEPGRAVFFTIIEATEVTEESPYNFTCRKGAEEDKKQFENIFWNLLGFIPLTGRDGRKESSVTNLTKKQWDEEWRTKIRETQFTSCKYVLVGFSSHGIEIRSKSGKRQPAVILSDGYLLPLSDILETLNDNRTLKDKPRILLLLSCSTLEKEPKEFVKDSPFEDVHAKGCPPPDLKQIYLSPGQLKFKCAHEKGVVEYQLKYAKEGQEGWTDKTYPVIEEKDTILLLDNLDPDTTYCVIVRAKNQNGHGKFSSQEFYSTLEAEDEGVTVHVESEDGCSDPLPRPSDGEDRGDPVLGRLKKITKIFKVKKVVKTKETLIDNFSAENIPNNFIIVYGTTRGQQSKRNKLSGNWFLQSLSTVLGDEKDGADLNLFYILTKVAREMSEKETKGEKDPSLDSKKSIMCFSHTLKESIMVRKRAASTPVLPGIQ